MRITRIDIEGAQAQHYATITRDLGSDFVHVEILTPTLERKHHVLADDRDDRWSMAECLQETLDGVRGSRFEINEYMQVIQRLAD